MIPYSLCSVFYVLVMLQRFLCYDLLSRKNTIYWNDSVISLPIIYPSILSLLILLISQSVIQCSGSPHCGLPLSETDDVVHNVFLNTQCMRYCDVIHNAPSNLYQVLLNHTLMHFDFQLKI